MSLNSWRSTCSSLNNTKASHRNQKVPDHYSKLMLQVTDTQSIEMRPRWFEQNCIPYKEMWPDDILWYPLFLAGKKFKGYFKFEGHDTIVDYTLAEDP